MNNKAKYKTFIEENESIPLFFRDWYLDLCTEHGNWNVIVLEEAGKVSMCLPYFLKQRLFMHYISMPHLCKFMGPVFRADYKPDADKIRQLYTHLPTHAYLQQNVYYSSSRLISEAFPNAVSAGQSYTLDLSNSEEVLWKGLDSDYRNNKIKKARTLVQLSFDLSVNDFYELNKLSFSRQDTDFPVPEKLFKTIISGMIQKQSALLMGVRDGDGNWHAGACLAWDEKAVYYHSAGTDPALRSSGGGILIVWEAISWARKHHPNKQFDFLGSNIPGIARVWKNFGAKPEEYSILKQEHSVLFKWLRKLKYRSI
jgi:hypothetical protein